MELTLPLHIQHFAKKAEKIIQTHISVVLLFENEVWKFKKAKDLGFLNFSSLDDRKHFCIQELERNQVYNHQLYKKVIGVTSTAQTFQVSEDLSQKNLVDVALVMNRFDDQSLLKDLLKTSQIQTNSLLSFAKRIALIHESAPANKEINSYWEYHRMRKMFINNINIASRYLPEATTNNIQRYFYNALDQHKDLINSRSNDGRVRLCHGDLHTGNIYLQNGNLLPFDCIEFNNDFAYIDCLYDFCFLIADIDSLNQKKISNRILNEYLYWSGDYKGIPLLRIYLAMRHLIRGYVSAMAVEDPDLDHQEKKAFKSRSDVHFNEVLNIINRPSPTIYWVFGPSGSGKSTVAKWLVQQTNGLHLNTDQIRKKIAGLKPDQTNEHLYTFEMSSKTYDNIRQLCSISYNNGWNVVIDGTYHSPQERELLLAHLTSLNTTPKVIFLNAPLNDLETRVSQRKNDVSDIPVSLIKTQLPYFTNNSIELNQFYLKINVTDPDWQEKIKQCFDL